MDTKAIQEAEKLISEFSRTAWIPTIQEASLEHSSDSKIGGLPFLRNENDWPICPFCQRNMQLFLQLNLASVPDKKEEGLVQLFYCTNTKPHCEVDAEAFFPFSQAVHCRRISISGESSTQTPHIEEQFPEKRIVGWQAKTDYPHWEDWDELNLEIDEEIIEMWEEKERFMPIQEDKYLGWPFWVQGSEYPDDRETGNPMELLFQLASHDNLPFMFGDLGIGHLTVSPDRKEELAFGWACG